MAGLPWVEKRETAVLQRNSKKTQKAKHASDPNFPATWHFAFYYSLSGTSSRHTSAPPPENQRDYEQHKEYEKQKFCDTRRCRSDTSKSKDRCHKCDN